MIDMHELCIRYRLLWGLSLGCTIEPLQLWISASFTHAVHVYGDRLHDAGRARWRYFSRFALRIAAWSEGCSCFLVLEVLIISFVPFDYALVVTGSQALTSYIENPSYSHPVQVANP